MFLHWVAGNPMVVFYHNLADFASVHNDVSSWPLAGCYSRLVSRLPASTSGAVEWGAMGVRLKG